MNQLRFSKMLAPDKMALASEIGRARQFAVWAHQGQWYGEPNMLPYVAHLDQVFFVATKFDAPAAVLIAAYLHDVLEDTSVNSLTLEMLFGGEVTNLVVAVTDEPGQNRMERHLKTYPKTRAAGSDAVLLKLCDRIANVTASIGFEKMSMYRGKFADAFRTALYVRGEHEPVWKYLDALDDADVIMGGGEP